MQYLQVLKSEWIYAVVNFWTAIEIFFNVREERNVYGNNNTMF